MADTQKVMVQFGADISALEAALKRAATMVEQAAAEMGRKFKPGQSGGARGVGSDKRQAARAEMARNSTRTEMALTRLRLQAVKGELAQEVVMGKITAAQKIEILKALTTRANQIRQAQLGQEMKDQSQSVTIRQQAFEASRLSQEKYRIEMQRLDNQMVIDSIKSWSRLFQPIDAAFSETITGVIRGTETLRQAMARMAQSIVLKFAEMGERSLTHWLATELAKTQATVSGAAARSAAEQAGQGTALLSMATSAIKAIANDAAATFAGVFAFLSPVMGPYAAGPAAASSATVAGMAGSIVSAAGGYDIPAGVNPIAQLHASEMVLPASLANTIRNLTGSSSGSLGAGDVHIHGPLVQAIDARSGAEFLLRNSGIIASALAREFRNANAALAAMST